MASYVVHCRILPSVLELRPRALRVRVITATPNMDEIVICDFKDNLRCLMHESLI